MKDSRILLLFTTNLISTAMRQRQETLTSLLTSGFGHRKEYPNSIKAKDHAKSVLIDGVSDCLKKANLFKYRKSFDSEKKFGNSGVTSQLDSLVSPRWRQRAYYDYLRDVFAIIYQVRLIRISVYDKLVLNGRIGTLGDLLGEKEPDNNSEILKFMEQKIIEGYDIA